MSFHPEFSFLANVSKGEMHEKLSFYFDWILDLLTVIILRSIRDYRIHVPHGTEFGHLSKKLAFKRRQGSHFWIFWPFQISSDSFGQPLIFRISATNLFDLLDFDDL